MFTWCYQGILKCSWPPKLFFTKTIKPILWSNLLQFFIWSNPQVSLKSSFDWFTTAHGSIEGVRGGSCGPETLTPGPQTGGQCFRLPWSKCVCWKFCSCIIETSLLWNMADCFPELWVSDLNIKPNLVIEWLITQ